MSVTRECGYAVSEPPPAHEAFVGGGWLHSHVTALTTEHATPDLTGADRCDACGAQAYVRVHLQAGELLFCAHHGRKYAEPLAGVATHIQDQSERLLNEDDGDR